jgi:hypothetical protein
MTGRQFSLGISGTPLGQLLAMAVMGVVLIGAVLLGSFLLIGLLGFFAIGYSIFWIRSWWRWRISRGRGPRGPEHDPARGVRFIEGEYEVIEADAEADVARRPSGGQ